MVEEYFISTYCELGPSQVQYMLFIRTMNMNFYAPLDSFDLIVIRWCVMAGKSDGHYLFMHLKKITSHEIAHFNRWSWIDEMMYG